MCRTYTVPHVTIAWIVLLTISGADTKGGAEEMKSLLQKLFAGYNPSVRPRHNYSLPTEVSISLHIVLVLGLDLRTQLMQLQGVLRMSWTDEYLQWNPREFSDIHEIVTPQNSVWKPDIAFYNAASDDVILGNEQMVVSVVSGGRVRWEPHFYLSSTCKLDMSKYPFDVSFCPVIVSTLMSDNQTVTFTWTDEPIDVSQILINGDLQVSPAGVTKQMVKGDQQFYEMVNFLVRLERRPAYAAWSLLLPVNLLAILSILSFAMPHDAPEKINISVTVLLSFTVFLTILDNHFPPTSHNISWLLIYISALFVLSFLAVVGNMLVATVVSCEKTSRSPSEHNVANTANDSRHATSGTEDTSTTESTNCPDVHESVHFRFTTRLANWSKTFITFMRGRHSAAVLNGAFLFIYFLLYVLISVSYLLKGLC